MNVELLVTNDTSLLGNAAAGARVTTTGRLAVDGILNNHLLLESGASAEINGSFDGKLVLQADSKLEITGIANIRGIDIDPESAVIVHVGTIISGQVFTQDGSLKTLKEALGITTQTPMFKYDPMTGVMTRF